MALQIRRGADGSGAGGRLTITPGTGELIYTTDTKRLYIGDGTTVGGNIISGSGLSNIIEDTSPQLGGPLDVNGRSIVSTSNGDINITPNGSGLVILHGDLKVDAVGNLTKTGQLNISPTTFTSFGNNNTLVDGNVFITRNAYSSAPGAGFTFAQHHANADAVNFTFFRTRGTGVAQTGLLNGDDIADISFIAHDGTGGASGAAISATVDGSITTGNIPTKFSFITNNGSSLATRAELSSAGVWKVNGIQNLSSTDLNLTGTGTVSATNSIISSGVATLAAGTILTVNGTVSGGSLIVGSILSGGTTSFGTRITAVNSATFTSTISTTTLTVSGMSAGTITVGMALSGGSVTSGTYVVAFVSGVNGGAGVYTLNQSATGTPTTGTSYTVSSSQLVRSTTITSGGNVNLIGNVKILGQNSLRFADADSSNWVAFQAPTTVAANMTWTLPATDGTGGQVLSTNGSGTLSWATASGVALSSRTTKVANTGNVADASVTDVDVTGFKSYVLLNVVTSHACRVRIYTTAAARTADAGRAEGVVPAVGAGVVADIVATGAQSIILAPGIFGHNEESSPSPTSIIPVAITNKNGSTATIIATLSVLQLEA